MFSDRKLKSDDSFLISFWYCCESDMTLIKWNPNFNYVISPFNSWIVAHDFFKPFLIILYLGNSYAVINPINAKVKGVEKNNKCLFVFLVCVCKRIKDIIKNVKVIKYFIPPVCFAPYAQMNKRSCQLCTCILVIFSTKIQCSHIKSFTWYLKWKMFYIGIWKRGSNQQK